MENIFFLSLLLLSFNFHNFTIFVAFSFSNLSFNNFLQKYFFLNYAEIFLFYSWTIEFHWWCACKIVSSVLCPTTFRNKSTTKQDIFTLFLKYSFGYFLTVHWHRPLDCYWIELIISVYYAFVMIITMQICHSCNPFMTIFLMKYILYLLQLILK